MAEVKVLDEDAHSIVSYLNELENETDTFGRDLVQHARDAQRLNNVLNGTNVHAFSKAKPVSHVALTIENLERSNTAGRGRNVSEGAGARRAPSVESSNNSDPPLNVPRGWGRKGRKDHDWLQRIGQGHATHLDSEARHTQQDDDTIHTHQARHAKVDSPHVDWLAAAGSSPQSLPRGTPTSQRSQRHASTPPSTKQPKASLDELRAWENEDFTATSLLASTPAVPSRNRAAIDDIRKREVQAIFEKGAVTKTLKSFWEQSPPDTRQRRSGVDSNETPEKRPVSRSGSIRHMSSSSQDLKRHTRRPSLLSNKENIPVASTSGTSKPPLVSYKSVESIGEVDQDIQGVAPRSPTRPSTKRADPLSLLKKLARVSNSPTGGPSRKASDEAKVPQSEEAPLSPDEPMPLSAASANSDSIAHNSLPEASLQERFVKLSTVQLETTTQASRERPVTAPQFDTLSKVEPEVAADSSVIELPLQTPVVTGAWVDTPHTAGRSTFAESLIQPSGGLKSNETRSIFTPESTTPRTHIRTYSEPSLPKSALDAVLQDMRQRHARDNDDPTLGDSTIASLEDLLVPSSNEATADVKISDSVLAAALEDTTVMPAAEDASTIVEEALAADHRQDSAALAAMDDGLKAAQTSIKTAKRGLERMEDKAKAAETANSSTTAVSTTSTTSTKTKSTTKPSAEQPEDAKAITAQHIHDHDKDGQCLTCGRHTSVLRSAWREYCRLYYSRDALHPLGYRLTWLGLACVLFWLWFAVEVSLSAIYSKPLYATHMDGYGVSPANAPVFPFVLPSLLFSPLQPFLRPFLAATTWVSALLFQIVAWMLSFFFSSVWGSRTVGGGVVKVEPRPGWGRVPLGGSAWQGGNAVGWEEQRDQRVGKEWFAGRIAGVNQRKEERRWEEVDAWTKEERMGFDEYL